jgi:hypothetical protein
MRHLLAFLLLAGCIVDPETDPDTVALDTDITDVSSGPTNINCPPAPTAAPPHQDDDATVADPNRPVKPQREIEWRPDPDAIPLAR